MDMTERMKTVDPEFAEYLRDTAVAELPRLQAEVKKWKGRALANVGNKTRFRWAREDDAELKPKTDGTKG